MGRRVVLVTGFGPFAGVRENPTSRLIHRLQELQSSDPPSCCVEHTHLLVLETAAACVDEAIEEKFRPWGQEFLVFSYSNMW